MKTYMLSPSLFVGNQLNIADDLIRLEAAGVELLHIDIMDPTFCDTTAMSPAVIPEIRSVTEIPLDLHLMTAVPEVYLPKILPYAQGGFVTIHIEVAKEFNWLAHEIRSAGVRPGVTLNSTTSISQIEEVLPMVDMVQVMMCDAGRPMKLSGLTEHLYDKVRRIKRMCESRNFDRMVIQCDAGLTPDMIEILLEYGANSFVLGRDSIFAQKEPADICIERLRKRLKEGAQHEIFEK